MARVQIFLSTVSDEFGSYREVLRKKLTRPNVSVAVQEDFITTGAETLDMLDDYIRQCDAVIHLVGDMTGALAQTPSLAVIRQRYSDLGEKLPPLAPYLKPGALALSYTQWEAWLALYHGKPLIIAAPDDKAPRADRYQLISAQHDAQREHLQRLAIVERYPMSVKFTSPADLAAEVLRSKLHEILVQAGPIVRPMNLPFQSLGPLFKGREEKIDELTRSLGPIPESSTMPVVTRVLSGLGGVGKTRLVLEYAWRHVGDYTALLFVGASSAEALHRNLAALSGSTILDLPERQEKEEAKQYEAVLRWLRQQVGWLLVLDNVDTKPAVTAVRALLPNLLGGHVLLTSRLTIWKAPLAVVKLEALEPEAAVDFLFARTDASRRKQGNDVLTAKTLVQELGCLSLALEQAGAYIEQQQGLLSFDGYLAKWKTHRDDLLAWHDEQSDEQSIEYNRPLAITWQTSFRQLTPPAQQLLQRLAWLAPDPIPESLFEVPVPGQETSGANARAPLTELLSYSLVTHVADRSSITVHRLVQEVTRRSQLERQPKNTAPTSLVDALHWINGAFAGDPKNPSNRVMLDPLLPHTQAVLRQADEAGVPEPTAELMNKAGFLLNSKAQYTEAESLYTRALAIREQVLGSEHPDVALSLNNLAALYYAQGAYVQAESLYTRALAIQEQVLGPEHPDVAQSLNNLAALYYVQGAYVQAEPLYTHALAIREQVLGSEHPDVAQSLNNLALLLKATSRLAEAELLMRRALAIDEASYGAEHPNVATNLNNLALLLEATNRPAESEPLMRRALTIQEQVLGSEHPDVALSLNNLAGLLQATNRLVEAEPLMRRALKVFLSSLGIKHPDTLMVLANYMALLQTMGKTVAEIAETLRSLTGHSE